jgi:RNA polymerase sigma factor (sigma-70 family)
MMSSMSALFRGSSTAAFDGLYRRHAATVYRYTFAVLGNHADAEDVTQTTFLNAYRALAQGVKPRKAENWLLTIAHNQVRQHFRSARGKPRQVELDDTLSRPAPDRDEPSVSDVLRALQDLSPAQRSAIVMREFEGRSYAEMAQIMGLTPSALEALIFRARRALAEQLEESLSCNEAEAAVSRRLDDRLGRRETRRLRAHMRECPRCVRFEQSQRHQRKVLKGLSVIPVPASLFLARGETAAAALGIGSAGAAAGVGGSAAAGGVAAAGSGLALTFAGGVTAKVAAVGAAVAVAGVGYGASEAAGDPVSRAERKAAHLVAVENTRRGARAAQVQLAKASGTRPGPALPAAARASSATAKAAARRGVASKPVSGKAAAATRAAEARSRNAARTAPERASGAAKAKPVEMSAAKPVETPAAKPKPVRPVTPVPAGLRAGGKPAALETPQSRPAKAAERAAAARADAK